MSERVRFGLYELEVSSGELRREGAVIHLQGQPAQVLGVLVRNSERVVTREELRNEVWGSETFVDFDRGLTFCISQIRTALRDDAGNPRFIRTIPKRGYQFIGPVEWIDDSVAREAPAPVPKNTIPNAAKARRLSYGLLATLVVVGLISLYSLRERKVSRQDPIVAVVPFDNETGDKSLDGFSQAVTDTLVERLSVADAGKVGVIGNAEILRRPRSERDLNSIASSLHASYVILGQVQADAGGVRILAHLIRTSDQTHVWVVRLEHSRTDSLDSIGKLAQEIASQFGPRLLLDHSRNASPDLARH